MIMDTLAGLAFAGEPPLDEYMEETPKRRNEPVINKYMLSQICFTGLYTVTLCIAFLKLPFFKSLFRQGPSSIFLMTAFFALFIFSGIFNSFSARTHRLNILGNLRLNPLFIVIMGLVCVVQLLLIYFGGPVFRTAGLTLHELRTVLLIAFSVVPADFLRKLLLHRMGFRFGV